MIVFVIIHMCFQRNQFVFSCEKQLGTSGPYCMCVTYHCTPSERENAHSLRGNGHR